MSQTLSNISRGLSSYGRQASNIQSEASRLAAFYLQQAANARARGISGRGQTLSSMVSGLGNMVGREFLEAPIRERELAAHDLNMRTGKQRLAMGQQELDLGEEKRKELVEAREKQKRYVAILAKHRGDPAAAFNALYDSGMPDLALQYRASVHELRKKAAEEGKAEAEEAATQHRILGETMLRLQNYPSEEWDEVYPAIRRQLRSVLGEDSPIMELLPETPEPGTYELMGIIGKMTLSQADILAMKKGELELLDKEFALKEKEQDREDENLQKAFVSMGKRSSKAGWTAEYDHQLHRLSPEKAEIFEAIVSSTYSPEDRKNAQEAGKSEPEFTGDFRNWRESGETGSFIEFKTVMAKIDRASDKGGGLTPSQALAGLRYLAMLAKERRHDDQFEGMNQGQIVELLANERGWDLSRLRDLAGGNPTDQEPPPMQPVPLPLQPVPLPLQPIPEVMRDDNGIWWKRADKGMERIK